MWGETERSAPRWVNGGAAETARFQKRSQEKRTASKIQDSGFCPPRGPILHKIKDFGKRRRRVKRSETRQCESQTEWKKCIFALLKWSCLAWTASKIQEAKFRSTNVKAKPERSAPRRVTSEAEKFLEKEILKRNSRNEPLGISRERILRRVKRSETRQCESRTEWKKCIFALLKWSCSAWTASKIQDSGF